MFLKGRKVRGIGIRTNFKNLPQPLTEEQVKELIPKLMKGDRSTIQLLIETHMRIALSLASKYATLCPQKGDDLVSVSMEGLVESVNNFVTRGRDNNLLAYISSTIQGRIADFLWYDSLIRVGRTSQSQIEEMPIFEPMDDKMDAPPLVFPDETIEETEDCVNKTTLTVMEYKVLNYRLEGYNDAEIGRKLGRTRESIRLIGLKLQDKFRVKYSDVLDKSGKTVFGFNWRE